MEFIPFEIAKRLNDIGYPQYNSYKSYFIGDDEKRYVEIVSLINRSKNTEDFHLIAAPTISQVLKWLRDEKYIFIEITVDVNDKFNYYFEIYKKGNDTWEYIGQNDTYDYFEMYEEAALAGVKYTLDNLI